MDKKINVLVIGGGMYTIGRGTNSYGTIVPAIFEAHHKGLIGRVGIVTTNSKTALEASIKCNELAKKMHINIKCFSYPIEGSNNKSYLLAEKDFEPDVAIVSTPDNTHSSICIALIKKGIHCLVVKPMASTFDEASKMYYAAKQSNVVAQVEFHKRLDESNLIMHDTLKNGELGKLLYAVIEYSQQKNIPQKIFKKWADKTSIFQYLGVHYVDLLQFITKFKPVNVIAWGQKDFLKSRGIETWDAMQVVVEWERDDGGQFISTHITNWIDPNETTAVSDQKINIVGTLGRYQADHKNRGIQIVKEKIGVRDINPYFSVRKNDPISNRITFSGYGINNVIQFLKDVKDFNDGNTTIDELDSIRPTFKNCIISTSVIESAHKSILFGNSRQEVMY